MKKFTLITCMLVGLAIHQLYAQFSLNAELRARSEYRDGARVLLNDSLHATLVNTQRTRLTADFQDDKLSLKISLQNARIWGEDKDRANVPNINLYEGWLRYQLNQAFALKVGRQELALDDGRIYGRRNWNDIGVSHDLAVVTYEHNGWSALTAAGCNNDANNFTDAPYSVKTYKYLAVLWAHKKLSENTKLSLLHSLDANQDQNNFTTLLPRHTSGVYLQTKAGKFDLQTSYYRQYGKNPAGLTQDAFMYSIIPQYKATSWLKIAAGLNYFSGNDYISGDTTVNQSFNKLFGDGHRYYGYMDYFVNVESNSKGTGMKELFLSFFFKTGANSELEISGHNFAMAGVVPDPDEASASQAADPKLGTEIDLQYKLKLTNALSARFAYATMFATPSMEILKGGDHKRYQQWASVMLIANPTLFKTKKSE